MALPAAGGLAGTRLASYARGDVRSGDRARWIATEEWGGFTVALDDGHIIR